MLDNIHFPQTEAQCVEAAKGFSEISSGNAICNCVSVIDGYLPANQTPSVKEVGNVRAFFNGHYQVYGVNVQAACNSNCRFQFIAVAGPGVMPDRDAVEQVDLAKKLRIFPMAMLALVMQLIFLLNICVLCSMAMLQRRSAMITLISMLANAGLVLRWHSD